MQLHKSSHSCSKNKEADERREKIKRFSHKPREENSLKQKMWLEHVVYAMEKKYQL
jgi:hypothetical protein